MTFEFNVCNGREIEQVPSSTGAAYFEGHVDVDRPVADVSLCETFDRVQQHLDVKMVHVIPEEARPTQTSHWPRARSLTRQISRRTALSLSIWQHQMEIITIPRARLFLNCYGYIDVEILAELGKITEVSYQLRAENLDHKYRVRSSVVVHGCDYTRGVLTLAVTSSTVTVYLEEMFTPMVRRSLKYCRQTSRPRT